MNGVEEDIACMYWWVFVISSCFLNFNWENKQQTTSMFYEYRRAHCWNDDSR